MYIVIRRSPETRSFTAHYTCPGETNSGKKHKAFCITTTQCANRLILKIKTRKTNYSTLITRCHIRSVPSQKSISFVIKKKKRSTDNSVIINIHQYLQNIYLKTNSQIYNRVLVFDEVVEFIVEISTNTHVCIHSMKLAGKFITTGLL